MKRNLKITLTAWPIITLIAFAVCYLTTEIAKLFGIDLPPQTSLDAILSSRGLVLVLNFFIIAIIAPVVEELIFRGFFYRFPSRFINHRVMAFVSSLLFSAAHHIQMPFPNNATLALFVFGLMQCFLYRRTGVLWSAMLTHSLFNLTNFVLLFLFK